MNSKEDRELKSRIYQRSLALRQAEKDACGAAGGEGEGDAKTALKTARRLWRNATDEALRKPP